MSAALFDKQVPADRAFAWILRLRNEGDPVVCGWDVCDYIHGQPDTERCEKAEEFLALYGEWFFSERSACDLMKIMNDLIKPSNPENPRYKAAAHAVKGDVDTSTCRYWCISAVEWCRSKLFGSQRRQRVCEYPTFLNLIQVFSLCPAKVRADVSKTYRFVERWVNVYGRSRRDACLDRLQFLYDWSKVECTNPLQFVWRINHAYNVPSKYAVRDPKLLEEAAIVIDFLRAFREVLDRSSSF